MNIIKKFVLIFIIALITILGIIPSFSYGEALNDAQRKALVDTVVKMIDAGNKSRILRYSQGHRMYGYNWRKVTQSTKQLTTGYVNLTDADLVVVKQILVRDLGVDWDDISMPKVKAYYCNFLGDDIKDTIPFDCSSLVSAAYNMTVGTPYGNWAWNSTKYSESSEWFEVTSDMSSVKPGDILWVKGHVAIYLGKVRNDGKNYIAEARGFSGISKSSAVMRQKLLAFLSANPKYIADHPNYNKKMPTLDLPANGVMDVTEQVVIVEYSPTRFKKVASYVGPISAGRAIDVTNLTTTNPGDGSGVGSDNTSGLSHDPIVLPGNNTTVWPKDMVLEDQLLATSEGYFYKGTPTYGQYIGRISLFNWLIEGTENVLDWIIGFVTYAFKAVLIGWTAIMENVISNILNFGITPEATETTAALNESAVLTKIPLGVLTAYNEEEAESKLGLTQVATSGNNANSSSSTTQNNKPTVTQESDIDASETKKKITIEDVLFNRVPVLDINFFDFENAGGQKLSEGSLLYKVRETIANWYYVIRMAVIMGMLVVLLYIGIKIAISVPSQKAEYKAKLIDWLVGFIIVFSIHYFMVLIINLNNQIVKVLDPVISASTTVDTPQVETGTNSNVTTTNDGQTSLYEAIRIQAYDIKATTGLTAAIMYMALVFFLIRFIIFYAKRMFILAVLTVISPIMGLLYSINKKKYKIGDWGKEYIYNVLIQFVHVVIYTAIVGLAFDVSKTSTFRGGMIALMTLAFLMGAENLVKKVFGFNKASSTGSLMNSTVGQLAAVHVASTLYNKAGKAADKAPAAIGFLGRQTQKLYNSDLQDRMKANWANNYNLPEGVEETSEEARKRRADKLLDSKGYIPNTTKANNLNYKIDENSVPEYLDFDRENYFNMSSINLRLAEAIREEDKARSAYAMQGMKDILYSTTGAFSVMAAVPMLVISPKYGLGLGAYGVHALASSLGRRKIQGAKNFGKKRKWTGKRLIFAWATSGLSEGMANMKRNSDDTKYVLQTTHIKKVELLRAAREVEDELAKEIVELELQDNLNIKNNEGIQGVETEKLKEAKEKMDEVARNIDTQEFEKAVNLTLQEVKKKDIEKIVENYMLTKKGDDFTNADLANVVEELQKVMGEKYKDLTLNEDFVEIVRTQVREEVVDYGNYKVVAPNKSGHSPTVESSDTADSIREKYKRNNDAENNTEEKVSMFGKDMTKTVNDDTVEKDKKPTERATVHIKDNDGKRAITREELEKRVDNVIKKMNQEEIVELIDTALKRKEAINREIKNPKYVKLMEKVKELKQINSDFKELTGEEIYKSYEVKDKKLVEKRDYDGEVEYQSVSDIVKNLRNNIVKYINGNAQI